MVLGANSVKLTAVQQVIEFTRQSNIGKLHRWLSLTLEANSANSPVYDKLLHSRATALYSWLDKSWDQEQISY
jgi:hypothetical protein